MIFVDIHSSRTAAVTRDSVPAIISFSLRSNQTAPVALLDASPTAFLSIPQEHGTELRLPSTEQNLDFLDLPISVSTPVRPVDRDSLAIGHQDTLTTWHRGLNGEYTN